jgi:hypothetical protein
MKNIYICCLILFTLSCKAPNAIVGTYKYRNGWASSILTLDSANKFKYHYDIEMVSDYSEGKWWVVNDTVFLRSDEKITQENGRVTEEVKDFTGYTVLNFFSFSGIRLQNVPVVINDTDTLLCNKEGVIKFDKPIKTVFVKVYYRYDFFYTKKSDSSNNLNIYIDPFNSSNKYFVLEKYIIKRRKLTHDKLQYIKQ